MLSWITIPLLGALIGWFTNWIAIKMLFHPHKLIHIGPWNIQGLIPRRQAVMAQNIAEVVSNDLLSASDLGELIRKHGGEERLVEWIKSIAGERAEALIAGFPMAAMFLGPAQIEALKEKLVEGIDASQLVNAVAEEVTRDADLKGMIADKIAAFDLDRLEQMVKSVASKEFRFIEGIGAVLGGLIGLVQVAIAFLTGF